MEIMEMKEMVEMKEMMEKVGVVVVGVEKEGGIGRWRSMMVVVCE
jgi:hypothetical protein